MTSKPLSPGEIAKWVAKLSDEGGLTAPELDELRAQIRAYGEQERGAPASIDDPVRDDRAADIVAKARRFLALDNDEAGDNHIWRLVEKAIREEAQEARHSALDEAEKVARELHAEGKDCDIAAAIHALQGTH